MEQTKTDPGRKKKNLFADVAYFLHVCFFCCSAVLLIFLRIHVPECLYLSFILCRTP